MPFAPSDLTGLTCWLKADTVSQADNTTMPATWEDSSAANHDGTRSGSPLYRTNRTPLGGPSVQFTSGSTSYFSLAAVMAGTTSGDVFVVVKTDSETQTSSGPFWLGNDTGWWNWYTWDSGDVHEMSFINGPSRVIFNPPSNVAANAWRVYNVTHDGTAQRAYLDGVLQLTNTTGYVAPTNYRVGHGGSTNTSGRFKGEIAEFILYDRALTITERDQVTRYLMVRHMTQTTGVTADVGASANPTLELTGEEVLVFGEPATVGVTADPGNPDIVGVSGVTANVGVVANITKPPGDDFAAPITLTGTSGSGQVNLIGATRQTGDPTNVTGAATAETVWLSYTPTTPGELSLTLHGQSDHPAEMEIWEATTITDPADPPVLVDSDLLDTSTADATATFTDLPLAQGIRYNIRVHPTVASQWQVMDYTWTYTERIPELMLTLRQSVVDDTPTTLIASVTNGTPNGAIYFTIDATGVEGGTPTDPNDVIWVEETDESGVLTDVAVPIPELLASLPRTWTPGYTLVATDPTTERFGIASFDVENNPLGAVTDLPGDAPPVLIPREGVQRWIVQDPAPGGTSYIFPFNPAEMTSPFPARTVQVERTMAADGQPLSFEGAPKPYTWEWRGYLDTQAHHDALAAYVASNRRYWLIDHRNRAWQVSFEALEAQPQIAPTKPWAHRYRMRCLIYSGPHHLEATP